MTPRPVRRPRFHFTPDAGWMNDPNGLVRAGGRWHMFYQKSLEPPYAAIGWGHAVSEDLVAWTDLGMAIAPGARGYVYSGSTVDDPEDADTLLAFFTRHDPATKLQTQERARSRDAGRTWVPDPDGSLLDEGLRHFRDPFIVRLADGTWRMLVVKPVDWYDWADDRSRIALYGSVDLRAWYPLDDLGVVGEAGEIFEVPVLLELDVDGRESERRWILLVSVVDRTDDGARCQVRYWVGSFDGERFTADGGPRPLDHGPDFYAATSFAGLPGGEAIVIGWMNSWAYARRTPATASAGGAQSVPRRLTLRRGADGRIAAAQRPAVDLGPHAVARTHAPPLALTSQPQVLSDRACAFALRLRATFGTAERVILAVRAGARARTLLTLDRATASVTLDRSTSGEVDFAPTFASAWTAPISIVRGEVDLTVLVDRHSVEVFAGDGSAALTAQIFPPPEHDGIEIGTAGGTASAELVLDILDDGTAIGAS